MGDAPDIELEFSLRPDPDEDLGRYVLHFEGKALGWSDEAAEEQTLGEIRGQRLDLATAEHDGFDRALMLESISPEVADFSETVLGDSACLLPASELEAVEAIECACIVYVSELRVVPELRGKGIGSALLKRMGTMIDLHDCLVALKAFPLADEHGKPASPEEIRRIKGFYTRHGFTPTGGDFMIKDARLCEAMKKRLGRRAKV
jgi:GNAT superfamily N-acetyltransferase